MASKKQNITGAGLLPAYFKKIGIVIVLITIVLVIVFKALNIEFIQAQKKTFEQFMVIPFILGLFFVAWAKDKFEDEMSLLLRLKAIGFSFICAIVSVIIGPFIDFILGDSVVQIKGQELVTIMLFAYLIYFWIQKKFR